MSTNLFLGKDYYFDGDERIKGPRGFEMNGTMSVTRCFIDNMADKTTEKTIRVVFKVKISDKVIEKVSDIPFSDLSKKMPSESSAEIRKRVNAARKLQQERFEGLGFSCNARISSAVIRSVCVMTDDAQMLLKNAFEKLGLSARAYDRILKVARTIADLDHSENINSDHIAEAIRYRSLDRKYWGG